MIETQAIRNICVETAKALIEAATILGQNGCAIKSFVTMDITLRGVHVDGVYHTAGNGEDYRENEVSVKGIGIYLAPNDPSNHVPDSTPQT